MRNLKDILVNEGADVRWFPEDYQIKSDEDAIEMISDLFSASTAPTILSDAFEEGKFDFHCFNDDKWLKSLGKALGDATMAKYEEVYG